MPLLEAFTFVIVAMACGYAAGQAIRQFIRKWLK